jgi:hypothetical protein
MAILHIEKLGGLANFGGTKARIRSRGQIDTKALSPADQEAVDKLFKTRGAVEPAKGADGFRFRISRTSADGAETVEAHEGQLPEALASCVKDEFV